MRLGYLRSRRSSPHLALFRAATAAAISVRLFARITAITAAQSARLICKCIDGRMSGIGTKRTCQPRSAMSAFGGKADIALTGDEDRGEYRQTAGAIAEGTLSDHAELGGAM